MGVRIISPNLNVSANNGDFESDPSTYGWTQDYRTRWGSLALDSNRVSGSSSLRVTNSGSVTDFLQRFAEAEVPNVVVGKKYIVKCWVFIPSALKMFPSDSQEIRIRDRKYILTDPSIHPGTSYTIIAQKPVTQLEALDQWVEITLQILVTGGATTYRPWVSHFPTEAANANDPINDGGVILVDQLEVFEYVDSPEILVSVTSTDVSCFGGSNGSAAILVEGGTPPYEYEWSDGSVTRDRNDLLAQAYTFRVTDSLGDFKEVQVVIGSPDQIVITATVNGQNVIVDVTGGTAPYTYAWSDGPTTKNRVGLPNGEYTLTVTDANGCTQVSTVTIGSGGVAQDILFYFTENPVLLELTATSPGTKPNLSFVCDLYVEKDYPSNNYELVIRGEQPGDPAGETIFDMQEMVKAFIPSDLPEIGQNQVKLSNSFRRFYLAYTEKYGDPPVEQPFTQADVFYCIRGGINRLEYAKQKFFNDYLVNKKPFLTWWPQNMSKRMYTGQAEFLYFLVLESTTTELRFKLKVLYDDNTESDFSPFAPITSLNRYEIYRIPVSLESLGLANPPKPIASYQVWLEDQANSIISEIRSYSVEEPRINYRQFLYENSLGGFDTLVSLAQAEGKIKIKASEINRDLPPNFLVTDAELETISKSGEVERQLGALLKNSVAAHLIDFALSRRIYEVRKGFLIPVTIKSSPEFLNEKDNYNEFKFTVLDEPVTNYTPEL